MAGRVLSVCVFCLICATHSPCASHADVSHENRQLENFQGSTNSPPLIKSVTRDKFKENENPYSDNNDIHVIKKRDNNDTFVINNNNLTSIGNKDFYLKKIFSLYGNGETLTFEQFDALLTEILQLQASLLHVKEERHERNSRDNHTEKHNYNNSSSSNISIINCGINEELTSKRSLDIESLDAACPAILYNLLSGGCSKDTSSEVIINNMAVNNEKSQLSVWLYSIGAVILISVCGVLSLVIIPVMQKKFYKPLLQFLVALAVGTLAGDALLHLLPHAMSGETHHHHGHGHHEENHENMWKGFVAMLGLILFFVMERFIPLVHRWKKSKNSKAHSHVKVLNSAMEINKAGDTQCKDKYNAYDRCYKDILDDPNTTFLKTDETNGSKRDKKLNNVDRGRNQGKINYSDKEAENENQIKTTKSILESNQNSTQCPSNLNTPHCTEANKMLSDSPIDDLNDQSYTVILSEHGAVHHGHSHVHGHVHAAPQNLSSVAWMVIMGDGLHNFTDGMAIGAAFSGSLAGGFSTAVAVFCHELPHELGDFAMLLKAGMSIKQAFFYNIISSILCIFGNVIGVWLGNTESASSWVFAVAAGTFIYIALVDMIPELSSGHDDEGDLIQSILHLSGLLLGFGIMTLIALYEHDLKNIFQD